MEARSEGSLCHIVTDMGFRFLFLLDRVRFKTKMILAIESIWVIPLNKLITYEIRQCYYRYLHTPPVTHKLRLGQVVADLTPKLVSVTCLVTAILFGMRSVTTYPSHGMFTKRRGCIKVPMKTKRLYGWTLHHPEDVIPVLSRVKPTWKVPNRSQPLFSKVLVCL